MTGGFGEEDCPAPMDEAFGKTGKITIKADDNGCVLTAKVDPETKLTVDENGTETTETVQSGTVTINAPLDNAKWTMKADNKTKDSDGETATVNVTGTIQGAKLSDCKTIPEGSFKVTEIAGTMKGS
ncbi:hypothetical protein [Nocardia colli]|uniref:hypothetical protein n=1 Tax=Nocardia colli TaxID=2545717 RepID=UPI0035DAFB5B